MFLITEVGSMTKIVEGFSDTAVAVVASSTPVLPEGYKKSIISRGVRTDEGQSEHSVVRIEFDSVDVDDIVATILRCQEQDGAE